MSKCGNKKCSKTEYNTEQQNLLNEQNHYLKNEVEKLKQELAKTNNDLTRLMHACNEQMDLLMEMVQGCLNIVLTKNDKET